MLDRAPMDTPNCSYCHRSPCAPWCAYAWPVLIVGDGYTTLHHRPPLDHLTAEEVRAFGEVLEVPAVEPVAATFSVARGAYHEGDLLEALTTPYPRTCRECGDRLPYGRHVATPVCDDCRSGSGELDP